MRSKHSSKKHRIVTLATKKITKQNSSHSFSEKENDTLLQSILAPKENPNDPQDFSNMQSSLKSNFKECKIKEFIGRKNHSPTHSDIEYLDTVENYKIYLKKTKNINTKKSKPQQIVVTGQKKVKANHHEQCYNKMIKDESKDERQKVRNIIQEKIGKAQELSFKYNSEKQFQSIYENIYRNQTDSSQLKPCENFSLISVDQYLKMIRNPKAISNNANNSKRCKTVGLRTAQKSLGNETRRWNYKLSQTQRDADPESLIRMINLDKWKDNKSNREKSQYNQKNQKKKQNISFLKINTFANLSHPQKDPQNRSKRPSTAPHRKIRQKFGTEQNPINVKNDNLKLFSGSNYFGAKTQENVVGHQGNKFPNNEFELRKKVKGTRHVERQRYSWKDFRKQSQEIGYNRTAKPSSTQVFDYPWNLWVKPSLKLAQCLDY